MRAQLVTRTILTVLGLAMLALCMYVACDVDFRELLHPFLLMFFLLFTALLIVGLLHGFKYGDQKDVGEDDWFSYVDKRSSVTVLILFVGVVALLVYLNLG